MAQDIEHRRPAVEPRQARRIRGIEGRHDRATNATSGLLEIRCDGGPADSLQAPKGIFRLGLGVWQLTDDLRGMRLQGSRGTAAAPDHRGKAHRPDTRYRTQ